jgi:hypothetical protein
MDGWLVCLLDSWLGSELNQPSNKPTNTYTEIFHAYTFYCRQLENEQDSG